jgi:hypothetical protein
VKPIKIKPISMEPFDPTKPQWHFYFQAPMAFLIAITCLGYGVWFGVSGSSEVLINSLQVAMLALIVFSNLIDVGRTVRRTDDALAASNRLIAEQANRLRELEEEITALKTEHLPTR